MKHSKKAIIVSVVFVLVVTLIYGVVAVPYLYFNNDKILRNELAGNTDCIIIGASHGLSGFVPQVLDENMECHSYNLCGSLITFNGRLALLEEEIYRNPVKTVVVDISYNAFSRPSLSAEGNTYIIPRFNEQSKMLNYFTGNKMYQDIDTTYSYYFSYGMQDYPKLVKSVFNGLKSNKSLSEYIKKNYLSDKERKNKGYVEKNKSGSPKLSEDEISQKYNSEEIDRNYNFENIEILKQIVKICRDKNVNVIFAVVTVSDAAIWKTSNWDDFYNDIVKISKEMDCRLIDFNLLKNRYELFSDDKSFSDNYHLCAEGARTFSGEFSKVINKINNGENVDDMFY